MVYYCTWTQGSLVQYLSFIWHSLHRSTIEYHTKVSVYLLSLAADPPSPDNVNERCCTDGAGEGLANIVIHSFQLTNQIRNECSCPKSGQLYSQLYILNGIVNIISKNINEWHCLLDSLLAVCAAPLIDMHNFDGLDSIFWQRRVC